MLKLSYHKTAWTTKSPLDLGLVLARLRSFCSGIDLKMTGRETALTPIKGSFKFVQGLEARAAMWRSPAIFSFSAKRSATAKYLGREMAKAKRKDPVEVEASGVSTATKRQKVLHEEKSSKSKSKKEQQSLVKSRKDGAGAAKNSEKVVTSASPPEALRIVSGSYEKVLCGIDAKFEDKSKKVYRLSGSSSLQNNLVLNPVYMFSAHTGAIKCLATNDRYLVSGGSDEVIKYTLHNLELTTGSTT